MLTLVPASVLTSLRLLQLDLAWAIRAVPLAPYAAPLYAVGLLALGAVGVGALRARDWRAAARWLAATLVVAALLFLHLSWLAPWYTGEAAQPAAAAPRVRIMTANVLRGVTSPEDLMRTAREADADVVVLQEISSSWWKQAAGADLRRDYPHVAGVPDDPGAEEPGTVVLSRRPLGRTQQVPTNGDSFVVPVRLGERTVDLLAVHPRNPTRIPLWLADQDTLAQSIKVRRPAVMAGDFNATFDHAQMQRYRDRGFRSADELLDSGWSPTWPDHSRRSIGDIGLPRLIQLDHVLVWRSLTVTDVAHLELPGSDHRAVVAEIAPV